MQAKERCAKKSV